MFVCSISYAKEIYVRVYEWPPLYHQDNSGIWSGLEVEIASKIIKNAGYKAKFIPAPWERSLVMMQEGQLQLMLNLSKTAERSKYMYWLGSVRSNTFVLVVKKENEHLPINTLDDFIKIHKQMKLKFGHTTGVNFGEGFNHRYATDKEFKGSFETIFNPEFNMKKVANNRILGFFEAKTDIIYQIKNNPAYHNLAIHPFFLNRNKNDEACYIGISKNGVDYKTYIQLKAAYQKLEKDGHFRRILDKYLNPIKNTDPLNNAIQ